MYSCGPTVYAPAHMGNFRSFIFADLVRRYLAWKGYAVTWVMNITDVDDKIIRDAAREGVTIGELTARYTQAFLDDLARLRITTPDVMPRATEHIPEMVALIETLLERGHAYRTDDGSVFFRIASWPAYGTLARLEPDAQRVGERVEADEYSKDDVRDFALWKGAKPGEPSWSTSIGEGRPGWHIECSAMSMRYLGASFDIHTGGIDLVFPHHEDEIAQSEAATGQRFVGTWLHCAHLQMGGEKMAKRTGNIARPGDLYAAGTSPRALRYALLAAHYRASLDFSESRWPQPPPRWSGCRRCWPRCAPTARTARTTRRCRRCWPGPAEAFTAALDDDLNISPRWPRSSTSCGSSIGASAERTLSTADAAAAVALLRTSTGCWRCLRRTRRRCRPGLRRCSTRVPPRERARDWARSDALRAELAALGIAVEDTKDGQRWRLREAADAPA